MIHVACAADVAYLPHAAAMLHSLLSRHTDVQVHFLHGEELTVTEFQPLAEMVKEMGGRWQAHFVSPEQVAGLPRLSQIPAIMWYRVYLPELLPSVDKLLYLDCDTLVMDDLGPLWETDLDSAYLGAVNNVMETDARGWPAQLGIPAEQGYFNSGVLLLNLAQMRADNMTEQLVSYGRTQAPSLKWPDQDALNVLLGARRVVLHPRWNCQNSLYYYAQSRDFFSAEEVAQAVSRPGILHFEGGQVVKPWHYLSKHPLRNAYFSHRQQTPWPDVTLEGVNLQNRLLRYLPMRMMIPALKMLYRAKAVLRRVLS